MRTWPTAGFRRAPCGSSSGCTTRPLVRTCARRPPAHRFGEALTAADALTWFYQPTLRRAMRAPHRPCTPASWRRTFGGSTAGRPRSFLHSPRTFSAHAHRRQRVQGHGDGWPIWRCGGSPGRGRRCSFRGADLAPRRVPADVHTALGTYMRASTRSTPDNELTLALALSQVGSAALWTLIATAVLDYVALPQQTGPSRSVGRALPTARMRVADRRRPPTPTVQVGACRV